MTVLEIAAPDGTVSRAVLRVLSEGVLQGRPSAAADEFRTLTALFAAGVRVPRPLLLDDSRTVLPVPYLVLTYIEGAPDYDPASRVAYEQKRARELARIHAVDTARPGPASLPRRTHAFASNLRGRTPAPISPLDKQRIHTALEPFWQTAPRNASVLLHGDLWPGNLLWRDGELVAVLDWEDACVGDPLADLAICRLDSLLILGSAAMDAFTERYLAITGVERQHLPYWDLCAALRAAPVISTWAAGFPALGRPDITDGTMSTALQAFADDALTNISNL